MIQSVLSAKQAILAQQAQVDVIANNIANVNTNGYKTSRAEFRDALYGAMRGPVGETPIQQGSGALLTATIRNFNQGIPFQTDVDLDCMIQGQGFFTVGSAENPLYTRNGSFSVSQEADGNYLVTEQGYYVLDRDLNRIRLPEQTETLAISADGTLTDGQAQTIGALNIVTFPNDEGLEAASANCYRATPASGAPAAAMDYSVRQGSLERSNVDMALEMTNLIKAQRAFSLASKSLLTAIGMEERANSVLG